MGSSSYKYIVLMHGIKFENFAKFIFLMSQVILKC